MLWSLNIIATEILTGNFLISRNHWTNVTLYYELCLPILFSLNSALILLLYFVFNIVLSDRMNHPSLWIFFFFWCYLAYEHLDARSPQKCDNWRVHNCVKFLSIVLLFCVGRRLRIKFCKVLFIHTRTSIHYNISCVHNFVNSVRTELLS
jgi:hypothetical protein